MLQACTAWKQIAEKKTGAPVAWPPVLTMSVLWVGTFGKQIASCGKQIAETVVSRARLLQALLLKVLAPQLKLLRLHLRVQVPSRLPPRQLRPL